jgi:hypothetical protein
LAKESARDAYLADSIDSSDGELVLDKAIEGCAMHRVR